MTCRFFLFVRRLYPQHRIVRIVFVLFVEFIGRVKNPVAFNNKFVFVISGSYPIREQPAFCRFVHHQFIPVPVVPVMPIEPARTDLTWFRK